jgi:enoyl-CoA hydratase
MPYTFVPSRVSSCDQLVSEVLVARPANGVVALTLNRPDRLNTLTRPLVLALHQALDQIDADDDCRIVVLTGAGRAFCAGLDLNGYQDDDLVAAQGTAHRNITRQREIAALTQRLHHLRQPVIAAINGAAAGGGLALALASDIRIASREAFFAASFLRAGYSACDLGTSWLLPRIVGAARAHELMLTCRRFDVAEAERIGLVADVVAPQELMVAALAKAQQILAHPPISVEMTKQGMWLSLEFSSFDQAIEFENRQQVVTASTEDQPEATAAFLEKRTPSYRNR